MKHIKQGSLHVQQKIRQLCVARILTNQAAPSTSNALIFILVLDSFCCLSAIFCSSSLNISDQVRAELHLRGGGALPSNDTSQTLPLALIGCVYSGAVDSCKSNYSHWVEPQTVGFYTADLYLILLLDHNDSFSKYNKIIVTDYSFKC